jgi:hypothetical protein
MISMAGMRVQLAWKEHTFSLSELIKLVQFHSMNSCGKHNGIELEKMQFQVYHRKIWIRIFCHVTTLTVDIKNNITVPVYIFI